MSTGIFSKKKKRSQSGEQNYFPLWLKRIKINFENYGFMIHK